MYDQAIKLVKETRTVDNLGDMVSTTTERVVFAQLNGISQSEFYQAAATGLAPEVKFVLSDCLDYQDERIIRYQPFNSSEELEYTVIRTYPKGNRLEIVCKRGVDR